LGVRKKPEKRAQVQPTYGPKWAFGKVLRVFRNRTGISQEGLAEAAGLDRSFVSLIERGIQTPNVVVLLKISEVLGVSASTLIGEVEETLRTSQGLAEEPGAPLAGTKISKHQRH
jgi:transcriptional regulator with XRE-family HTH domain